MVDWKEVDRKVVNRVGKFIYDFLMLLLLLMLSMIINSERKKNG